jgi:hypothetical protein
MLNNNKKYSNNIKDCLNMNKKDPMKIALDNIKKDDKILKALAGNDSNGNSKWQKYYDTEPIHRLKNEGRELLGEFVVITEKRDGENVSIWLNGEDLHPVVSSHNQVSASPEIINRFKTTPEYAKVVELLKDETKFENHLILYGELLCKVSPTRIEKRKKNIHWILFDIYDLEQHKYLSYPAIYQKAYHYHIPIVRALDTFIPQTIEDITINTSLWLKWCKQHSREGIVGKCYKNQVFYKEKIDLPKLKRVHRLDNKVIYPPMPEEKIIRALQHAFDVVGEVNWKNVKIAMPEVAKQLSNEAREHFYATPMNMFRIYNETPIDKIKPQVQQ